MKDNVKAFNNDEKLKERFIKEAEAHQKADRFIQGSWLKGLDDLGVFKGCFFGCMTQTEDNTLLKASEVMALPLWLVHVAENIFEGLPKEKALLFPLEVLKSVPIGMDNEKAYKKWNYDLLTDQLRFTEKDSEQYKAVKQCADLFLMDEISKSAESAAASAAYSAAYSAESAAASAAYSAAWAAARSAESAAASAAWAAESAQYVKLSEMFINVLKQS